MEIIVLKIFLYGFGNIFSKHLAIAVVQGFVGVCEIMETIGDLNSNFYTNGAKILLATVLLNIIVKAYEYYTALPEIDHVSIKLDL